MLPRQHPCPLRRSAPRPGCGSQRLLRCRSHPAGRSPNSSSLFPPLAAVVAVAPKGRALGISVKFPLDEQSLSVSWTVVPCCPGQRQLDKVRCPEAAALCNKARPFAPYCASSVQLRAARPAKGSPRQGSCLRSRLRGFSHTKKRQTRICLFFHALIALLSPSFSA